MIVNVIQVKNTIGYFIKFPFAVFANLSFTKKGVVL